MCNINNFLVLLTVSFDKDACFFSQRSVGADTIYHVTYDGTPIDPLLCSMMKFSGGDSSRINTYRVCVSLLHYEDPDCAIWFGYIIATDQIRIKTNIRYIFIRLLILFSLYILKYQSNQMYFF